VLGCGRRGKGRCNGHCPRARHACMYARGRASQCPHKRDSVCFCVSAKLTLVFVFVTSHAKRPGLSAKCSKCSLCALAVGGLAAPPPHGCNVTSLLCLLSWSPHSSPFTTATPKHVTCTIIVVMLIIFEFAQDGEQGKGQESWRQRYQVCCWLWPSGVEDVRRVQASKSYPNATCF
jgi:hypothetical protein